MMKQIAAAVLLVLLLANPADLSSCGPFFPTAIFTGQYAPDNERAFYSGQLGIVQRTYARRYLAMAYRILSGEPLMPAQVDAITDLERRYRTSDANGVVKTWLAARQQAPGATAVTSIDWYRRTTNFSEIAVCTTDAFATATNVLAEYVRRYGKDATETKNWLNAQDEVFANCGGKTGEIPEPTPAGSDEFVVSDREYQIAAANFYAGNYDAARAEWSKIAADTNSRWQVWAPYLIARSYLRESNYEPAVQQLRQMLVDPREASLHRQAGLLLDRALAKLDPSAQLVNLSRRLMEPDPAELGHDLSDFTFIWDQSWSGSGEDYRPGMTQDQRQALFNARLARFRSAVSQSDLSAWVAGYSSKFPMKPDEALTRWQTTKSIAWLLAAAPSPEVETALRAVPADSPAYASARSNLAVMLSNENKNGEAAHVLDEAMQHRFDLSSMNQFHAERMKVAESFEVFLAHAPREAAKIGTGDEEPQDVDEPEYLFDNDAASAFNESLPLSSWLRAARARALVSNLKANIAQAGWVRSVLIGKDVQPFADVLAAVKPEYAAQLGTFAKQSAAERQFAEIFWMLHHPELGTDVRADLPRITKDGLIDVFRDNWWCAHGQNPWGSPQPQRVASVHFLNAEQQHELAAETTELNDAGPAPVFLSKKCVEWVQAHPQDARNAEALALAVKTSRLVQCNGGDSTYVERAFRLLHNKYPNSDWTKKTPYWFK